MNQLAASTPRSLIAFEGIDGSGKGTQSRLLYERLSKGSTPVQLLSFPRYGENAFADLIGMYLDGSLPSGFSSSPYAVGFLYSADRHDARQALTRPGVTTICDRYASSNLAHMGARLEGTERSNYINWTEELEYEYFSIPRPTLTVLLNIDPTTAARRVLTKEARSYTERSADVHERDVTYLAAVSEVYRDLASTRESWLVIESHEGTSPLSPQEIHEAIWAHVAQALPGNPSTVEVPSDR